MTAAPIEKVNGTAPDPGPRFGPRDLAEAEAIRARAAADAEARRIAAEAEAEATRIKATEEAEQKRIANERARMKLQKDQAAHAAFLAEKAAKEAAAKAAAEKAAKAAEEQEKAEVERAREQERTETVWKWGARSIYAVGLIIAAPVQFLHFWDPQRKFLVAAPALLEGLALVLAFGAAWAVAHRRDVAPYRVGIMLGAVIAAGINLYGGMSDERIGLNAGLIGAIASLGGPIVLMAYEHGIAQKADGIPSWRERRAEKRAKAREDAARAKARAEKEAAETKAAAEKRDAQLRAEAEQKRRDDDRRHGHPEVWDVADAMRSARGAAFVTEQIWAEAWYRVTGCKTVGITLDIEAQSRAAQARMRTVTDMPVVGESFQLLPQVPPSSGRGAADGPKTRGVRRPGDTAPFVSAARKQASITAKTTAEKQD